MVILYNFVFWYPVEKMSKYRICVSDDGITKRALREERVDLQYAFIIIRLKVRANHHHQGSCITLQRVTIGTAVGQRKSLPP